MSNNEFFGALGFFAGLAGICFFGYQSTKMSETAKKLDMSLEDLARKQPVDIQEAVVNKAVQRAVEKQVQDNVANAIRKISNKINSDMNSRVKEAVNDRFDELSKKTSSLVAKEISGWDLAELKRNVKEDARDKIVEKLEEEIDEAKEKAHEKFEKKLDSILDSYDGKLTTEFKYELLKKLL